MSNAAKEARELVKLAVDQGWRLEDGKHFMLFAPDGEHKCNIAHTPSEHRWRENALRDLRAGGFVDPAKVDRKKKADRPDADRPKEG